jgi:hypothetical protein
MSHNEQVTARVRGCSYYYERSRITGNAGEVTAEGLEKLRISGCCQVGGCWGRGHGRVRIIEPSPLIKLEAVAGERISCRTEHPTDGETSLPLVFESANNL